MVVRAERREAIVAVAVDGSSTEFGFVLGDRVCLEVD